MSIRKSMEDLLGELIGEVKSLRATSTELYGHLRGQIANDVLLVDTIVFDSSGIAVFDFPAPYGSVHVANLSPANLVVVSADTAQGSPPGGRGSYPVPPRGAATIGLHGRVLTIYGTAGDRVGLQVFTRAWPPVAAESAPAADLLVTGAGADNAVAATLPELVPGMVDPSGTVDRMRSLTGADGAGAASFALAAMQPSSPGQAVNTPAANVAAVITFAAVAGQRHRLTFLAFSYSAAPTGGRLTVTDGGTTIIDVDIIAGGQDFVPLPPGGLSGTVNTAMTLTLAAAGAAVSGKLSAAKVTA